LIDRSPGHGGPERSNDCSETGVLMNKNLLLVGLGTLVFAFLGVALYVLQGPVENPTMNFWGVLSFAALGTSIGCLVVEPADGGSLFD